MRSGEDFSALAREYSEDPGSRRHGGDIGYLERGSIRWPDFERAVFSLKPGEADTVRSPLGYHVVFVEGREDGRVHVRHILLRLSPSHDDSAEALVLLDSLRRRAISGEDFERLVEMYSEDQSGRRSWVGLDQLPEVIRDALSSLMPGRVGGPVRGASGFYLVKLYDRRKEGVPDLERDRDTIREWAFERRLKEEFERFISEEREKLYVEVRWDRGA